ncbi:MAG: ABC transporter ATP-binding protein, partial [Deltaproteobacteria bacterium]|nr:ABC transporter ATP-binding protein [Deltaproteobacteria bacterium]
MKLIVRPPEEVLASLRQLGCSVADLQLALAADVGSSGDFDPQWLIATARHVMLFDPARGRNPACLYTTAEISDVRTIAAIGSGLLQLKIDSVWIDVVRFSNRLKFSFDRAAVRLGQLVRGEPVVPVTQDARDSHRCPKCDLMLEFSGELCPRCIDHGAALSRVLAMMRPYWRASAVMMALLVLGILLDLAWPLLTRFLVDYVLAGKAADQPYRLLAGQSSRRLLAGVVTTLALVHVTRGTITAATGRIAGAVGNSLTYDVRSRLVDKLQKLGLAYYGKQETGSLVGRVAYDTEAVQSFITQLTSGFFMQLLLVLFSFIMMLRLAPHLALWTLVPAPLVIAGAFVYWRYVHPRFQRLWDRSSKQAGTLNGILSGIRVVKAFGQESHEQRRFDRISAGLRDARRAVDRTSAVFYPVMAIVFQVGGWIVWYVGGVNVLNGQVSLGTLMAFFGYLSMFYGPLGSLTNLTTWLTQFSTQMHRILEILDAPAVLPEARDDGASSSAAAPGGAIEFDDVTFGYSRGQPVLQNLSFRIAPGSRVGIVGRSGSGKTSLINLLCRFYDVDSGAIRVDGVDVRQLPKDELRRRISLVLQEPFLFRGTLAENIRYGRPEAPPEEILAAARAASAHGFIMSHPLAYDTSVGERGFELSGGERQRVSIARALLCR